MDGEERKTPMTAGPTSLIDLGDIVQMVTVAAATPPGDFIEVGVYQGGSAWYLAKLACDQERVIYLCDTFKGLPYHDSDKGDTHKIGEFGDVSLTDLAQSFRHFEPHVVWVPGVFPQSWSRITGDPPFAFAHIDCDQYRSVKETAQWLIPRMVRGGIIWFDDVDRLQGASLAAEELFGGRLNRTLSHPYVRFP